MKVGTDGVLLGAWAKVDTAAKCILDIGTGTGLLALMMAQKSPESLIDSVEIDHQAFLQASENFAASPWSDRLKIYPSPIQKFAQIVPYRYDLIITNPPYFHNSHKAKTIARTKARHSDSLSSDELLKAVKQLLQPKGSFQLILPTTEGLQFQQLAKNYGLHCHQMMHFKPKPNKPAKRLLMAFRLSEKNTELKTEELVGRGADNLHTNSYRLLTGDFYLDVAFSK